MTTHLLWQFDLVWALADVHLTALVDDDFCWEPAPLVWTVRPGADGTWRPDWADAEPHPIPVPTIGWLTWHIQWWWSTAIDHLTATPPRERTDVTWPGDGALAVERIRTLAEQWRTLLIEADPTAPSAHPADRSRPDRTLGVPVGRWHRPHRRPHRAVGECRIDQEQRRNRAASPHPGGTDIVKLIAERGHRSGFRS